MKMTARDRALLAVAAVLLLCGAFYKFAIMPEHQKAGRLQTQVVAARTALAKAQQLDLAGRAAVVALRHSQSDWVATQHAVPKVADVPALLKLLSRTARAAHVSMESIALSNPGSGTATVTGAVNTALGLTTVPVSLTFNGGYQALNRLIDHLDTLVTITRRHIRASGPLVGISAVTVSPSGSTADPSLLSIQLTATIYQRSAGSAAATSTEAAG